jgi:ribonuclease HI
MIEIYTDGAGNNSKIGWAWILTENGEAKISSQGFAKQGTNNIAELSAVISAVYYVKKKLKKRKVTLISDSQYIVNAINDNWLEGWKRNEWRRSTGKLANANLWKILDKALEGTNIEFKWVRGHNGNTWNEVADKLAVEAKDNGVNKLGKYTNQIG